MKKITNRLISFIALFLVLSACDDFLNINVSPNSTINPPAKQRLASATGSIGFHMGSDIHRFTSEWVQHFTGGGAAGIQTVEYARFNVTATDLNNVFRGALFGDVLADLQALRTLTQDKSPKYAGISKICQAFIYSIAVDAWGDLPYTEALQFEKNLSPKYDNSADIYTALFALIDDGIVDITNPVLNDFTPAADDLIYGGNLTRWNKFANSLKLRMLIKYYPTDAAFATAQITALVALGPAAFIAANNEQFQCAFETTANRTNAIDQFERSRQNQFWPTTTLVDMMNLTTDPRRPFYFSASPGAGLYTGLAPGVIVNSPATSRHHTYLRGAVVSGVIPPLAYLGNQVQRMLTYAEHQFNLAEFYIRDGQGANALTAFQAGITANMQDAGVSGGNITAYLTANGSLPGPLATDIQKIITEKYIANFGVAVQPWSDWRRTGVPLLSLPDGAVLTTFPRILPYSDLERVTNPVNTPVRGTADLTLPNVFWDPGI